MEFIEDANPVLERLGLPLKEVGDDVEIFKVLSVLLDRIETLEKELEPFRNIPQVDLSGYNDYGTIPCNDQ